MRPFTVSTIVGSRLQIKVMKLLERVLNHYIRKMMNINEILFGCVPDRDTTQSIFSVYQMQGQVHSHNKRSHFAIVALEKASDRVPRKVLWWSVRSLAVTGWAVCVSQDTYSNARCCVKVKESSIGVGVHRGSVPSPLLFTLILKVFCTGVPWEFLCPDDLVLMTEILEEVKIWKITWKVKDSVLI